MDDRQPVGRSHCMTEERANLFRLEPSKQVSGGFMKITRPFMLVVVAASIASHAGAQVNAFQAWEDARAIRRVATVAGKGMPEDLLTKMSNDIVTALRGKLAGGTWQWAYYTREEAGKTEDNFGLKSQKGEEAPS